MLTYLFVNTMMLVYLKTSTHKDINTNFYFLLYMKLSVKNLF